MLQRGQGLSHARGPVPGCRTLGPRPVPGIKGQGVLSRFHPSTRIKGRSTLGLSQSHPMSPRPKEPCSLCASPCGWEQDGGAGTGTGDTAVPQEHSAQHTMGRPSVRNEDRPLFTLTKGTKKIKYHETSLPLSPALQRGIFYPHPAMSPVPRVMGQGPTTAGGHLAPTHPSCPMVPWDARRVGNSLAQLWALPSSPGPQTRPRRRDQRRKSLVARQGGEGAVCIALGCRSQHRGGEGAGRMHPTGWDPTAWLKASASPSARLAPGGDHGSVLCPALEVSLGRGEEGCSMPPSVNQSNAPEHCPGAAPGGGSGTGCPQRRDPVVAPVGHGAPALGSGGRRLPRCSENRPSAGKR